MSEPTIITDLVVAADDVTPSSAAIIDGFRQNQGAVYSSFNTDKFEDKMAAIKAATSAADLADNLGVVINLKNFVLQGVIVNGEDGPVEAIRTVLIDTEGKAYASVATGVRSALETIIGVAGHPDTWGKDKFVPVVGVQTKTRVGRQLVTLEYAG